MHKKNNQIKCFGNIFGKPVIGYLCFKYSKMNISTNYLCIKKPFFKCFIFENLWNITNLKVVQNKHTFLKAKLFYN